mgnify:CR=1 FL=1
MDLSRFVQTDVPYLLRDKSNMAIINNDVRKYELYKKSKANQKKKDEELIELKNQLQEMKEMLAQVISQTENKP